VLIKKPGAAKETPPEYKAVAGFKVLGGPDVLKQPSTDPNVVAFSCRRDTIVPGKGDFRVNYELGKPLVIEDATRKGVLVRAKDQGFRFQVLTGTMTEAEKTATAQRLDLYTASVRLILAQNQRARAAARPAGAAAAPAATPAQKR
jgi:hypothetical protein